MKTRLLIFFLFSIINLFASKTDTTTTIIFLHPTVNNIETFIFLTDNKYIDIENVKFIGVYYENEKYDYTQSEDFLNDTSINYIALHKVIGDIEKESIYTNNNLTHNFDSLFNISDGIVFMGGPDISPSVYREKTKLLTSITDPYRHFFELSFMYHLLGNNQTENEALLNKKPEYVIWAICLGMQTMNVATGGSLIQDIPSEVYGFKYVEDVIVKPELMHKNYFKALNPVDSLLGAKFHKIKSTGIKNEIFNSLKTNKTPYVLSWHHQAVKKIGYNLQVIFNSIDGRVVEGLTHSKFKNIYGFQFHPEYTKLYRNDIKLKEYPNTCAKPLKHILEERSSLQFHKSLWEYYSSLF